MNERTYREFFLKPSGGWHRRYEALRAHFVEQRSLADVARQWGLSYGTVCNWVSQFRAQRNANQPPPFFWNRPEDGRRERATLPTSRRSRPPMSKRCR
jgi:transposase-like protein